MPDVYLVGSGAVRGGGDRGPAALAAEAAELALAECGRRRDEVDTVVLAAAVPTEPGELALAAAVAERLSIAPSRGAYGAALGDASGLLAIALAAEATGGGRAELALAGGADAPSRVPLWVPGLRGAPRAEAAEVVDPVAGAAAVAAGGAHAVAAADGGDRDAQDRFARRSHELAGAAAPSADALAALKPVHAADGTITTGNSAAAVDGAEVAVLARSAPGGGRAVRVAGWALTKGRPGGPAASLGAAVREAAAAVGAAPADLAAVEIHEESAALCLGAAAELGLDPDSINRRGGAIATGSAGAAAGPALVSRARDQLLAADGSGAAVAAMPAPGDQALALALELAGPESL